LHKTGICWACSLAAVVSSIIAAAKSSHSKPGFGWQTLPSLLLWLTSQSP
jgi:hypothetical protein